MNEKDKKKTGTSGKTAGSKGKSSSASGGKGKSSSASGSRSKSASASAGKGATRPAAGRSGAAKTGKAPAKSSSGAAKSSSKTAKSSTEPARNPRRDSQAERDLHNSPNAKRLADERRRRKYNKNRRLYNFMFYAAIAVAVISVVIILSVTVLFNISTITVERGQNVPYSDEEILAACGIEPGDNLFAIDTEQAALDVTTGLPYIEVCNVSRRLPSTLELDVHAAVVLGSVTTTDGAYIVLSANGRALEYADAHDPTQPLTRLNGMEMEFGGIGSPVEITDEDELRVAAELVVGFSLYELRLDEITFDKAGAVSVIYDGRINIEFGMPTNLSQKVQVAASMISEGKIARNEAGTLDLSINERAVFTPDYLISSD
ncbi:MAG: FtsQ-type POTRA domain-containing protein [Ruminococcaceae bacterium]|nr:FtsQ-type POTRA domain-containing protein [Oscillospiraceae bacterium]